ncbi:NAD kinase [Mycoplasmatota bacterium zrk1]
MFATVVKNDLVSKRIEKKLKDRLSIGETDTPKIVFCIGGDGTILRAIHKYSDILDDIIIFGIHTGHLGFFMDFNEKNLDNMIDSVINESFEVHGFNIAEAELKTKNKTFTYFALNEFQLIKVDRVIVLDVYIDDKKFETFRGTGLCFSTPGGSTGMNRSLGGAIVDPDLHSIQLTELASINSNAYRTIGSSLILGHDRTLHLKPEAPIDVDFCYDHLTMNIRGMIEFSCSLSDRKVRIAYNKNNPFFERVKQAFL